MIALAAGSPAAATGQAPQVDRAGQSEPPREIDSGKTELTKEEKREVEELEQRDAEVRRHEQAHKAAAGQYAQGSPQFEYETGPDGKRYAAGGEVQIDTSPVADDPEATILKMQQIQRAANAPAEPSSQDRQIAAEAASNERQARAEVAEQSQEEFGAEPGSTANAASGANAGGSEKLGKLVPDDSALRFLDQALAAQQQPATGQFIDSYI